MIKCIKIKKFFSYQKIHSNQNCIQINCIQIKNVKIKNDLILKCAQIKMNKDLLKLKVYLKWIKFKDTKNM